MKENNMVQKNIQRKTSAVFLCGVFSVVFVLSTCLNPVGASGPELPPGGGPNVLTVHIGGQSTGSRTAMPDTSPSVTKYSVTVRRGASVLGSDSGTTPVTVSILDAPRVGDIVSVDGFNGNDKVVSGTAVVAADNAPDIDVYMYPANEGKGNIDLEIAYSAFGGDDAITSAGISYYQGFGDYQAGKVSYADYQTGAPLASPIHLTKTGIPAGDYVVKIEFFRQTGVKIKTLVQTALVRNGHTTNKWDSDNALSLAAGDFASSDAELTGIGITGGPAFTFGPATYSYAISEALPGGAISRTLNISKKDGQKIETTLNGTALAGSSLSLKKGDNSIVITVTAQDGVTSKTYTIGYTFYHNTTVWEIVSGTAVPADHKFNSIDEAINNVPYGIRATYASGWPGKGEGQPVPAPIQVKTDLTATVSISDVGGPLPPILLEGDDPARSINGGAIRPLTISNAHVILGDNLTLKNGNIPSSDGGGGVLVSATGSFTMNGGTIRGNTTAYSGGGVSVSATGSFTMNGGTITDNTAGSNSNGGGVYVSNGGSFTMNGGTISDNDAGSGGGVSSAGSFTMNGGTIGGDGGVPNENRAANQGGGVYVAGGTFNMNGGTIKGNATTSNAPGYGGGGVFASNGFTMRGGSISENQTSSHGGGVYVTNGTFAMEGGTISGNRSGSSHHGGGVYVNNGGFTMSGEGTAISGNRAVGYSGGGVYINSGSGFSMSGGAAISGNQAASGGGGVAFSGSAFNMTGGTISGNRATTGGGVVINSGTAFNMSGTISGNTANGDGGGVYFSSGSGSLTMNSGSIISGNTANGGDGGGVHIDTGSFTMSDGAAISGNRADARGGGVAFFGTTFTMSGTINGNTANGDAGGVLVDTSTGTFNMNGGSVSGNSTTSTGSGGGVCLENGIFNMNGGSVSGNTCDRGGGGMYCNNGTFNMNGGTISGNEASNQGGGGVKIYGADFTMSDGSISGNRAVGDYGGGVYLQNSSGGSFTMSGGSIIGNTANINSGGGVAVNYDAFTMSGNARVDTGNRVYLSSGTTINLSGALSANPAANIEYEGGSPISPGTQLLSGNYGHGDPPNFQRFQVEGEPDMIDLNGEYTGP